MGDSSFASGFKTGFGSAFLQFAFERLASFVTFAWKEIGLIWGIEDDLRKLNRTFLKIQDLVYHVESSPMRFSGGSKAWQVWFQDIQKLSYDADALLDHISLHLSIYCNKHSVDARQDKQVLPMLISSLQLDVPHEVNEMQKKLEVLANEAKSLVDVDRVKMGCHEYKAMERYHYSDNSSLLVDEQAVVGRVRDREDVIGLLGAKNDTLSVIPLVGMGGIGKTTLAQLIFNSEEASKGFELRIWVSVSIDFDVKRITKSIIESATLQTCEVSNLDPLQRKLQEVLISKEKFLLVLDDYWNENPDDWDLLSAPFKFAPEGSKIIVTTRSNIVSTVVGSVEPYTVHALSTEDCWRLMKQRAFLRKEVNQSLESLGRDIAEKCKGLPLAAKSLGNLLNHKPSEYEWVCIANSELWDLPLEKNEVFSSLMLSYLHLPAHLQKCFAYCSIFPQNHEFEVKELVHLWMAEGFIQPQGEMRSEDIGMDYFNDLHMRSLFQPGASTSTRTIYKMHGLIHDLARLVSINTCFQVKHDVHNTYPLFGNACHLSLHHHTTQPLKLSSSIKNERLRTFMVVCTQHAPQGSIDPNLFCNLKYLRSLCLCDIGLLQLPDSIDELAYLRCLNLCGNKIEYLPQSMCTLVALQTLVLHNCPLLVALPKGMKNLTNLRHLMFDIEGRLSCMPPEFGKLTNLQTLSAFIVRRKKGHGIEELKNMDLKGSLCVKNMDKVLNVDDASDAKMNTKRYLDKLELVWEELEAGLDDQDRILELQMQVLKNLEPHENLKELEIKNYSGVQCPNWLCNPLRKLARIHLRGLSYCRTLPSLGELPLLEYLLIEDMDVLERVDQSFYGLGNGDKFPSLVSLEIYQMNALVEWIEPTFGIHTFSRVSTIKFGDCPELRNLPTSLETNPNKTITRCPWL